MGVELVDVVEHPRHPARVVHHDHAARAGHRAAGCEGVEIERDFLEGNLAGVLVRGAGHLELLVAAHDLGGRAARDHGLEGAAGLRSAAEVVEQFTHRHFAHLDLIVAGGLHVAGDAEDTGSGIAGSADPGVFLAAHVDDVLDVAEGLHVVDDGGAHVEPHRGGKIGGLDARVRALAFQRLDQSGLLAADIGAGSPVHVEFAAEPGAGDVLAEKPFLLRLPDGLLDDVGGFGKLFADVDVSHLGSHRIAGDHHALDKLVGILVDDVAVLEGAGFGLVAVADQVDRLGVVGRNESPLHPGRESRSAASPQAGLLDLLDDLGGFHLEGLPEFLVAAVGEVGLDGRIPPPAVDVAEDHPFLPRVGFPAFAVGDLGHGSGEVTCSRREGRRPFRRARSRESRC